MFAHGNFCLGRYIDHVARLKPLPPGTAYHPNRGAAYIPMRRSDGVHGEETPEGTIGTRQAWLHRGSVLHSCRTDSPPQWLVYQEVTEGRYRGGGTAAKRFLRHLTALDPKWLAELALHVDVTAANGISHGVLLSPICLLSPPLPEPPPYYCGAFL